VAVGSKVIGSTIQQLGKKRDQIRKFFASIKNRGEYVLIDGTHILNNSCAELSEIGYSASKAYRPQVNLLYIFDKEGHSPLYYRLLPGNIREVKSFQLSLKESGLSKAVIIADKGFYSNANIQELEDNQLSYIIPLQRSSSLINYKPLQPLDKKNLSGYFTYAKRTIWYSTNNKVTLFLDEELRLAEERDYLSRIETHPEKYSLELFHEKQHTFGTMALISNISESTPEKLYCQYKSRCAIEQLFDSFKNLLAADRTYMRTDEGLEGWMFINFIALSWYYKIYAKLLENNLLTHYSVNDVLQRSAKIKKVRINDTWYTSEITAKTQKLLTAVACPVT
jgi:transposase